jgi:hypothetical protein
VRRSNKIVASERDREAERKLVAQLPALKPNQPTTTWSTLK